MGFCAVQNDELIFPRRKTSGVTVKPANQEVINDRLGNDWKPAFDYKVKLEGAI